MEGRLIRGQLTYVNTNEGIIEIEDFRTDIVTLDINSDTSIINLSDWENLIGNDIEAVAIDGVAKSIDRIV